MWRQLAMADRDAPKIREFIKSIEQVMDAKIECAVDMNPANMDELYQAKDALFDFMSGPMYDA